MIILPRRAKVYHDAPRRIFFAHFCVVSLGLKSIIIYGYLAKHSKIFQP